MNAKPCGKRRIEGQRTDGDLRDRLADIVADTTLDIYDDDPRRRLGVPEVPPASMRLSTPSESAIEAWNRSVLGRRLGSRGGMLLEGAREAHAEGGDVIQHIAPGGRPLAVLVVNGLVRVYASSVQGRQVTVRYVASSEIVGLPTVLAPHMMGNRLRLAVQAVTDAELLRLSVSRLRYMVANDPEMASAVVEELTGSLMNAYELLAENVFEPVRNRVARHLLDLAEMVDGRLVVHASQQSIADSIASVREVVSRVLIQMRDAGLIERIPNAYHILDPAKLHRLCA